MSTINLIGRLVRYAGLLALAGLLSMPATAQTSTTEPDAGWDAQLAADESTLFLAQVLAERSVIYQRGVNATFERTGPLKAPIAHMLPLGGRLHVFVGDGRFYTLAGSEWSPALDLPGRVQPLDLVGVAGKVYALIPSPSAGQMPRLVNGERPPASQPFDPQGAALSLVRYDARGWAGLASCPDTLRADLPPRLGPRLAAIHDELHLFWWSAERGCPMQVRFDAEGDRWGSPDELPPVPDLRSFWITSVSGVPTLVAAVASRGAAEELHVLRLLGGASAASPAWRDAPLRLSELAVGVSVQSYQAAAGFNQHLALLMVDQAGASHLRFGRIDAAPAETSILVRDVFAGRAGPPQGPRWVQSLTVLVLFAVLIMLFMFRRGAMVRPIELPAQYALALAFQRLAGLAIDLVPIAALAALLVGVDPLATLRELFGWAAGSDAVRGRLPDSPQLWWWGISTGTYTLYSLVFELMTRRTLGKLLTGTRLLSESGQPPSAAQTLLRNVLRFIELLPPLWVLGFLVVLSRNRQRVGDIFAHTLVVRHIRIEHAEEQDHDDPS